jgi:hypothetical protein
MLLNFTKPEKCSSHAFFRDEGRGQVLRRTSMKRLSIRNGHSFLDCPPVPRLLHGRDGVKERSIHIEEKLADFPFDGPFVVNPVQSDRPATALPERQG